MTDGSEVGVAYRGKRSPEEALQASAANIERIRKGTIAIHSRPGARIEVTQTRHAFRFGTAVGILSGSDPKQRQRFLDHVKENFNAITFENSLKWNFNDPARGNLRYQDPDALVHMRGHCVFWGSPNQVQNWVKELSDEELRQAIFDDLWKFKLPIAITEFDVNDKSEQVRAKNLHDLFTIAFGHEGVEEITMWGFRKGMVWKPHTHLWEKDYTPNAAGKMYRELVYNRWWTRHEGLADASGITEVKAFYGNHRVVVDGRVFEITLDKQQGRAEIRAR